MQPALISPPPPPYQPVSIPQAVSTVATVTSPDVLSTGTLGFNTASGKYCCNYIKKIGVEHYALLVSIPQAVSTVATAYNS